MAKWKFYVSRLSGNFWNPYEKVEAGVFEGSQEEAQKELSERISRTWSPYVTHDFEPIVSEQSNNASTRTSGDAPASEESSPL